MLQELLEHENISPNLADDIARAKKPPRKPRKAQSETGWHHSGAGRIYRVALPDTAGVIVERLAELYEVIPQRIIEQALGVLVTLFGNLNEKQGLVLPLPPHTTPTPVPSSQVLLLEKVLEAKNEEMEELQKRLAQKEKDFERLNTSTTLNSQLTEMSALSIAHPRYPVPEDEDNEFLLEPEEADFLGEEEETDTGSAWEHPQEFTLALADGTHLSVKFVPRSQGKLPILEMTGEISSTGVRVDRIPLPDIGNGTPQEYALRIAELHREAFVRMSRVQQELLSKKESPDVAAQASSEPSQPLQRRRLALSRSGGN